MSEMWREARQYAQYQGEGPDDWPEYEVEESHAPCPKCGAPWDVDCDCDPRPDDEEPEYRNE